jgi:hypothetical protein
MGATGQAKLARASFYRCENIVAWHRFIEKNRLVFLIIPDMHDFAASARASFAWPVALLKT